MKLPRPGDALEDRLRVGAMIRENAYMTSFDGVMIRTSRPVAVSFLRVARDRVNGTLRFLDHVSTRGMLDEPTIAPIVAVGTHEDTPWIAIEEVRGKDLDLVVAEAIEMERPIEVERAVDVTLSILRALQVAHRAGIAHWELSPWSVAIEDLGDGREATVVLDLGVAHAVRSHLEPGATSEAMRADVRAAAEILLELLTLPGSTATTCAPDLVELTRASASIPARYTTATDLALALMTFAGPRSSDLQHRLREGMHEEHPALRSMPTSAETPIARAGRSEPPTARQALPAINVCTRLALAVLAIGTLLALFVALAPPFGGG